MNYKIIKFIFCIFLVLIILTQITPSKVDALQQPIIRVLIRKDNYLRIRSDGSIPLRVKSDLFFNKKVKAITLRKSGSKTILFFDDNKKNLYELNNKKSFEVISSDKRGVWVGGKRYSGIIKVSFIDNEIYAVNILGIEKYLTSVVGSEMPHKWPLEALKAQAIASRTYALKKKGNELYDVDSTQSDQVYNGLESGTNKTRRAVRKTRSLVIIYDNKLINAQYHSSSGGRTENSEDVWNNYFPYLLSVKDFDHNNPKLKWKKIISEKEMEQIFPQLGSIKIIQVLDITDSGRIKTIKIIGEYGSEQFSGQELRTKLNLKSTLFRVKILDRGDDHENSTERVFLINGIGAGHGVGMSQWGAKFLAEKGIKAIQILTHYYQGVEIMPFDEAYK